MSKVTRPDPPPQPPPKYVFFIGAVAIIAVAILAIFTLVDEGITAETQQKGFEEEPEGMR